MTDEYLRFEPVTSPPAEIGIGCRGPKLTELAGKIADSVLLDGIPQDALLEAIQLVQTGEKAAGRSKGACRIASFMSVGMDKDAQAGRQQAKRAASWSVAMAHPYALAVLGLTKEDMAPILHALPDRTAAAQLISDELISQFALTGTVDDVITQLDRYQQLGLEEVILMMPQQPGVEASVKQFGKYVIPSF